MFWGPKTRNQALFNFQVSRAFFWVQNSSAFCIFYPTIDLDRPRIGRSAAQLPKAVAWDAASFSGPEATDLLKVEKRMVSVFWGAEKNTETACFSTFRGPDLPGP